MSRRHTTARQRQSPIGNGTLDFANGTSAWQPHPRQPPPPPEPPPPPRPESAVFALYHRARTAGDTLYRTLGPGAGDPTAGAALAHLAAWSVCADHDSARDLLTGVLVHLTAAEAAAEAAEAVAVPGVPPLPHLDTERPDLTRLPNDKTTRRLRAAERPSWPH